MALRPIGPAQAARQGHAITRPGHARQRKGSMGPKGPIGPKGQMAPKQAPAYHGGGRPPCHAAWHGGHPPLLLCRISSTGGTPHPMARCKNHTPNAFFMTGSPGPARGPFFSKRIFFGNKDPDPHRADFKEKVVPPGLQTLPRGCASKS